MKKHVGLLVAILAVMLSVSCDYINDLGIEAGLNEGLVAYWPVTETSGTTVKDYSGAGFDLTLTGSPAFVSGKYSYALSLNGTSQYATLTNLGYFPQGKELSVAAWIYSNASDCYIIRSTTNIGASVFYINQTSANTIEFYISTGSGTVTAVYSSLTANKWHYICGTYDSTTAKLFVDGLLVSQAALSSTSYATQSIVYIGYENGPISYWQGYLDEIRIYNRALSQDEIKKLMDVGRD